MNFIANLPDPWNIVVGGIVGFGFLWALGAVATIGAWGFTHWLEKVFKR